MGGNVRHNSQGLVIEEGKNPRLVWDGSTMYTLKDIVMNNMTPTEEEAEVTCCLMQFLVYHSVSQEMRETTVFGSIKVELKTKSNVMHIKL